MTWCFVGLALISLFLGVSVWSVQLPRLRAPTLRPGQVMRGCVAGVFMLSGLIFSGLALALARWLPM